MTTITTTLQMSAIRSWASVGNLSRSPQDSHPTPAATGLLAATSSDGDDQRYMAVKIMEGLASRSTHARTTHNLTARYIDQTDLPFGDSDDHGLHKR